MTIEKRRVLVIAYYFPPMGLSGVQRTLKFVKYLPELGWSPTVLTVEPRGYLAMDDSLLEDLDERAVNVIRTAVAGPGRFFGRKEIVKFPSEFRRKLMSRISDTLFIPDNKIGWRRKAVAAAIAAHEKTPFDLIFATAPPFTDFLVGADVKAQIGKPLVLDYRDPWFDYPFKFYPTPYHSWSTKRLEGQALRASSHVITTNRRVKELLIQRYPFLGYHDVDIIPQGFDPQDIEEARQNPEGTRFKRAPNGVMRLCYAGVFWEDRKPDSVLQALQQIFRENPELRGKIEASFIGNFREENVKLVAQLGLEDSVKVHGYLPHRECVRHLLASDLLWVIVGDGVGSPGKTYEYIGTGKPILGLAPEGFLKAAIEEAGGKVVPPQDVEGVKKAILQFHEAFRNGNLKGADAEVITKYDRRNLTAKLARIFESLYVD
jgi:glycosyltransferase involved in cell wall biosynthesis